MKQFLLPEGSLENANELTLQTKGCLHHTAILLRLRPQESADIFETAYFFLTRNQWIWSPNPHRYEADLQSSLRFRQNESALKIKKICFSPKVPIQSCRPAPSEAIWAQLKPK